VISIDIILTVSREVGTIIRRHAHIYKEWAGTSSDVLLIVCIFLSETCVIIFFFLLQSLPPRVKLLIEIRKSSTTRWYSYTQCSKRNTCISPSQTSSSNNYYCSKGNPTTHAKFLTLSLQSPHEPICTHLVPFRIISLIRSSL